MGCGSSAQTVPHNAKEGEAGGTAAKGLVFRVKVLGAVQLRSSFSIQLGDTNQTRHESTRDPYVVLKCTGTKQVHHTSTVLHNSDAPTWHEEFFFEVDRYNPVLTLEVKDKEAIKGDITVGTAKVKLHGMISKTGEKEFWVPLVDSSKQAAIPDVVGELGFTITECYRMEVQPQWATRVAPLPTALAKGLAMETKMGSQPAVRTSAVKQADPKWSDLGATFYVPYGEVSQVTFTLFSTRIVGPPLARGFFHLKLRGQPLPAERNGLNEQTFPLHYATPHDAPGASGYQIVQEDKQVLTLSGHFEFGVCIQDDITLDGVPECPPLNEEAKAFWPPSKPATLMFDCHVKEIIGLPESDNPEVTAENTKRYGRLEYGRDTFDTQTVGLTTDVALAEKFKFVMQPPLLEDEKQKLRAAKLQPPSENEAYAQLRLSMWEKMKGPMPATSLGIGVGDLRTMRPGCAVPLTVPVGEATFKLELQLYHRFTVKIKSVAVLSEKDYNGLCDPFVTLRMGGTSFVSRVVPEDREALFNDEFQFIVPAGVPPEELQLKVEVWDADFIFFGKGIKKDLIGLVEVDLSKLHTRQVEEMDLPITINNKVDGKVRLSVSNDLRPKDSTLAIHEARYGFRAKWVESDAGFLHPSSPSKEELEDLFSAPSWLGFSSEFRLRSDFPPTWVDATKTVRQLVEDNKLVMQPPGDHQGKYLKDLFWPDCPDPDACLAGLLGILSPLVPPKNPGQSKQDATFADATSADGSKQGPATAAEQKPNEADTPASAGDGANTRDGAQPSTGDSGTPGDTGAPAATHSGDAVTPARTPTTPPPPSTPPEAANCKALEVGPRMLMVRYSIGDGELETAVMKETGDNAFEQLVIDPPHREGSTVLHSNLTFAVDQATRAMEDANVETQRLQAKLEKMEAEKKKAEDAAEDAHRRNQEQQEQIAAAQAAHEKQVAEIEARVQVLKAEEEEHAKKVAKVQEQENAARITFETAKASASADTTKLKADLDKLEDERKAAEARVADSLERQRAEEKKLAESKAATMSEAEALEERIAKLKAEEEESAQKAAEARKRADQAKAESAIQSAAAAEDAGRAAARAREKANAEADEADRLRQLVEEYEAEKVKAQEAAAAAKKEKEEEERQMAELRREQEKEAVALEAKIAALTAAEQAAQKNQLAQSKAKLENERREREEKEQRQRFQREETARQERLLQERIERLKAQENESAEKLKKAQREMEKREADAAAKAKNSQSLSGASATPSYWTPNLPMDGSVHKVELTNDPLWRGRFQTLLDDTCRRNTLGAGRDQIIKSGKYDRLVFHKAWRLENAKLYSLYAAHRDLQLGTPKQRLGAKTHDLDSSKWITQECGLRTAERNELLLWHGTKPDCVDLIATDGFDERFSKLSGLFGAGVYLADEVSKSDQYTTPTPSDKPKTGVYHIFLVRATMGDYKSITDGTKDARRAPAGCQSILGQIDRNKYKEYVLYDGWLAYPEYILEYKRNYVS